MCLWQSAYRRLVWRCLVVERGTGTTPSRRWLWTSTGVPRRTSTSTGVSGWRSPAVHWRCCPECSTSSTTAVSTATPSRYRAAWILELGDPHWKFAFRLESSVFRFKFIRFDMDKMKVVSLWWYAGLCVRTSRSKFNIDTVFRCNDCFKVYIFDIIFLYSGADAKFLFGRGTCRVCGRSIVP